MQPNVICYDQRLLVSGTMTTNTMPIHATMLCFLMLLIVPTHEGSANLGETCKCGVASAAADAAATAAIIVTDSDDTVDVAASTAGLSLFLHFNKCIRAL